MSAKPLEMLNLQRFTIPLAPFFNVSWRFITMQNIVKSTFTFPTQTHNNIKLSTKRVQIKRAITSPLFLVFNCPAFEADQHTRLTSILFL